jgi:hypothetical protein
MHQWIVVKSTVQANIQWTDSEVLYDTYDAFCRCTEDTVGVPFLDLC